MSGDVVEISDAALAQMAKEIAPFPQIGSVRLDLHEVRGMLALITRLRAELARKVPEGCVTVQMPERYGIANAPPGKLWTITLSYSMEVAEAVWRSLQAANNALLAAAPAPSEGGEG